MQILVVVASSRVRAMKIDVERGFTGTAVGLGSNQFTWRLGCSARAGFALNLDREWS